MDTQFNKYIWNGEKIPVTIDFGRVLPDDRMYQTLDFTYKTIHVRFSYLHESTQAFLVFYRICDNIDKYGADWENHFYFRKSNFCQDGEKTIVL
jgi:hypothetical protein